MQVGLFLFGVAHWTAHRIHGGADYAKDAGFRGPLVTANLFSALSAELVTGWAGPGSQLHLLDERDVGSAFAGDTVIGERNGVVRRVDARR